MLAGRGVTVERTIKPTRERRAQAPIIRLRDQISDDQGGVGRPYRTVGIVTAWRVRGLVGAAQEDAAERYADDVSIAGLIGLRAAPMEILGHGNGQLTDSVIDARQRWWGATRALGGIGAPAEQVAWNVLGNARTIRETIEGGHVPAWITREAASVLLRGAVFVLAEHYGLA